MVKTSLEWPSRFALSNISLYSSGHKQIQEHFTGIFPLSSSFLSSFFPFYFVGWTSSTLSILSPACTLRRVGRMGWRLTPMATKGSHIPGLGGPYGLSPINLCGSSVSETFPVGPPSNGWVLWCIRAGFLNFSSFRYRIFCGIKKSYRSPQYDSVDKGACSQTTLLPAYCLKWSRTFTRMVICSQCLGLEGHKAWFKRIK